MAHFAELDENNIVKRVIVVDNKEIMDPHLGREDEIIGIAYCKKILGGKWIQTSYNGNTRVRFAGIGFSYNQELDAFIPPKPFESWILNTETADWESPVGPAPELTEEQKNNFLVYEWDEESVNWKLVQIPIL